MSGSPVTHSLQILFFPQNHYGTLLNAKVMDDDSVWLMTLSNCKAPYSVKNSDASTDNSGDANRG